MSGPVGDKPDLVSLYAEHAGYVRSVVARYGVAPADLDDACHDVFLVAEGKLSEFRGDSAPRSWLHSIARFVAMGRAKHDGSRSAAMSRLRMDLESTPLDEGASLAPPTIEPMDESLWSLGAVDQDVLSLHFVGGLSVTEIALLVGVSRPTVRARLRQASSRLEEMRRSREPRAGDDHSEPSLRPMSRGTRFISRDVHIDLAGDVIVAVFRGPGTFPPNLHIRDLILANAPDKMSYFGVYETMATAPRDPRVRAVVAELMTMLRARHGGLALTFEGPLLRRLGPPGFNAAMFLSRSSMNMRFFGAAGAAAEWLTPLCQIGDAADLVSRVDEMRGELDRYRQER